MFLKADKHADTSAQRLAARPGEAGRDVAPSILSRGLTIVGNLTSDGEIQIDGRVEGDIVTRALTIGEGAEVIGRIQAETAVVKGRVNGFIRARSVTLAKSANVVGDIVHQSLTIEPGACLEGNCRRQPFGEGAVQKLKIADSGDGASGTK